ncbi:MAG: hypothetical protein ABMA64_18860 [Myxococcota bacterium]
MGIGANEALSAERTPGYFLDVTPGPWTSMTDIAPTGSVRATAQALSGLFAGGARRVQVTGEPAGAGRTMLTRLLRDEYGCVTLLLPDLLDGDAVGHGLVQARRAVGLSADAMQSLDSAVGEVAHQLVDSGRWLVLRLPESWASTSQPSSVDEFGLRERAEHFLRAWMVFDKLSIVLISNGVDALLPPAARASLRQERLPTAAITIDALRLDDIWGDYAAHARALHGALRDSHLETLPIDLRLAVGLVAMGERPRVAAQRLYLNGRTVDLARMLTRRAIDRGLEEPLRRMVLLRNPVPLTNATALLRCAPEFLPLFTHCFGYADELYRVSDLIRTAVRGELGRGARREAVAGRQVRHLAVADLHEASDGALSPNELTWERALAWLDKVHHLAHAGERGAERWMQQAVVTTDQLVDRARVLSRVHRDWSGAAALYGRCIDIDALHHYAWHYLGYNLDMGALDRTRAEVGYRRARDLRPDNPWYSGRLVTFLIGQARYADAEKAWNETLHNLDPAGDRTSRDPWLARQVHRWVALSWLQMGEVKRARAALEVLSPRALEEPGVAEADHQVRDAEEARDLGVAVRPPGMKAGERERCQVLPSIDGEGRRLERWYAGRVQEVSDTEVTLVYATPAPEPDLRRVLRESLTLQAWRDLADADAHSISSPYFELGEYEDSLGNVHRHLRFVGDYAWEPSAPEGDPMRWLRGHLGT